MNKSVTMKELASVIGDESTQLAMDVFQGRPLYFPKKRHMIQFQNQEEKEQHIKNLFWKAGHSVDDIAVEMELTPKHVRDIIRKR